MKQHWFPWLLFFGSTGAFASWLVYTQAFGDGSLVWAGGVFCSTSVIAFSLRAFTLRPRGVVAYYFLLLLCYGLLLFITFLSSFISFVVGIFTAALGAVATFWLAARYIRPFRYSRWPPAALGAAAFLVNDAWAFVHARLHSNDSPDLQLPHIFAPVFFLWQAAVGTLLLVYLENAAQTSRSKTAADHTFRTPETVTPEP